MSSELSKFDLEVSIMFSYIQIIFPCAPALCLVALCIIPSASLEKCAPHNHTTLEHCTNLGYCYDNTDENAIWCYHHSGRSELFPTFAFKVQMFSITAVLSNGALLGHCVHFLYTVTDKVHLSITHLYLQS